MSKNSNKISYLKGLVDGKNFAEKSEEAKVLMELIDIVSDVVEKVDELEERVNDNEDFKESLMDGISNFDDMMSSIFGVEDEEDYEDFFDGLGIEEEDDNYEVTCEKCGKTYIASFDDFIDDNVVCPNCGTAYNLADDIITRLIEGDHKHD